MAPGDGSVPPVYQCRPPEWLPKAHSSADLGYVGFFPPRPDQDEEILTEAKVKNGLTHGPLVPTETYNAQDIANSRLDAEETLSELEELMNLVFSRRAATVPTVPASSFKLPSRVTLNDARRKQWFADLANPEVPLHKLGKSVPHGAKGHDLLDLLHDHNVAVPRAVWFLRVFGANETAGLRNKPSYNPTQYSVEWANVVTGYMRKQLIDIALPMAPRPGFNIKVTLRRVLADQDSREKWLKRFTYCLKLLKAFYSEGLVDNRTFLAWLVQQMGTCNLAQLGFVGRLADEYLDGLLGCRALTRPFVEASLNRISEIRSTSAKEHLTNLTILMNTLITRTFLASPDAFVSPKIWAQHSGLFQEILSERVDIDPKDDDIGQTEQALIQAFVSQFEDVKKRNEALLFRNLPPRIRGTLSSTLADIKLLNSFSGNSDIDSISFFAEYADNSAAFSRKLDILLTWGVTPLQFGDHRGYVAATLLQSYRDREEQRAIRRGREPDDFLQDQLFDWLDCSEAAGEAVHLSSVALLFGQLVKRGIFSYSQYIQRLIARGEPNLLVTEGTQSRHCNLLRWIPLHSTSTSLIAQRKATLYGVRMRETPEDINERSIRQEIRSLLPGLFGGDSLSTDTVTNDLRSHALTLLSATRFEQIRIFNDWLIPVLKKALAKTTTNPSSDRSHYFLWSYCVVSTLLAHCRCYDSMLAVILLVLRNATTRDLITAVLHTVRQHIEVWAGLDAMKEIVVALRDAQSAMKLRGMHQRALYALLFEIDGGRLLEPHSREQLCSDYAHFNHSLHPDNDRTCVVPDALPEILLLTTDPSPDAPIVLANTLWYKYRNAPDWAWKVWDNTIASLRQIPSMIDDIPGRRACALRYATFLTEVDQHISTGSDDHILSWFLGSGRNEVEALSAEAWDVATVVLLHLSIYDALATTTILQGLVYPIWQTAAFISSPEEGSSIEVLLEAVNELCFHLLLKDACGDGHPPFTYIEIQGIQTRRRDVYREPHFSRLVANIPALVLVEQNVNIPERIRQASRIFREALCSTTVFRLGVYRDLAAVNTAFEQVLTNREIPEELHEPLVNALRLMFNEGQQGSLEPMASWQMLSTLLSPWKLAATSIELRFTMKQLGEALRRDATRDRANLYLDKLTLTVFGQGMNSEEADFMAEIMKSISPEVTNKFINAGVHRILEILNESARDGDLSLLVTNAGDILRLLANVAGPIRKDGQAGCTLDPWVQDRAIQCLHDRMTALLDLLNAGIAQTVEDAVLHNAIRAVIFLARVLQFVLGFVGTWSQDLTTSGELLCSVLFKLILISGSGRSLDPVAFPLLIDTLYFLLDELPTDPKAVVYDPFRYYPQVELQSLSPEMPEEYRREIRHLLPYVPQNICVHDLAYQSKDSSGTDTLVPVQNRPWEWTEYLGETSPTDANQNGETNSLKNSTSLPLELFAPRPTGERIVPSGTAGLDACVDNNLRMFQDNPLGESIFKRDWRESRVDPERALSGPPKESESTTSHMISNRMSSSEGRQSSSQSSRVASPAPSLRSRGSVQPLGMNMNASPAGPSFSRLTGSTAGDPIDVDSLDVPMSADTTSGSKAQGKRKIQDIADDDEIEIIDGPVANEQAAKRLKGTAATSGKTRSKKR